MHKASMKHTIPYFILIIAAILADQISKAAILSRFQFAERLNIIPHFFDLTLVYNPGSAFSFLADAGGWQKFFFLAFAAVVSIYLIRAIIIREFDTWGNWGAAMVCGGAIGNAIDRLVHGHVVDFISVYYQNWYYPAFNVADSFICVGALLLVIDGFKKRKHHSE